MGTNNKEYINDENKEEILNLLRDQDFISQTSSKELEKIINSLDFKSLFNIIQNKSILNKINIIKTNILEKDSIFFPNFLDSPTLIKKTFHTMIYDMLNYLNSTQVLYYLVVPYIREQLTDYEVIELLFIKEIPFNEVVKNDYLFNSIPVNLLVDYINKLWIKAPNSKILTKKVIKKLFDINDKMLNSINLDEVNYLFETIKMKNILSIQETSITLSSYRALLSSYFVLGINKTLMVINKGNKDIKVNTINILLKEILDYELQKFYSQNYIFLHDIEKNVRDNLKLTDSNTRSEFTKKVKKNFYLKSLIDLMLENKFASFDRIIGILYNVNKGKDIVNTKRNLSSFCNNFVKYIIDRKKKELEKNMQNSFLKHFELKKSVREREYRKLYTDVLQKLKLKLLIDALKDNIYSYAFKNKNITQFLDTYRKFIKESGFEEDYFINYILIPLSNGNFDVYSFLNNQGIMKPYNYDSYKKMKKDKEIIFEINAFLKEIKRKYNVDTIRQIIENICYGTSIKEKVHKKDLEKINIFHTRALNVSKEIYINKEIWEIDLQGYYDIFDDYELINYISCQDKIEKIIKKTINYLNYYMNSKEIKQKHFKELLRLTSKLPTILPLTETNYSLVVRPYTFEDLERIFEDFNFNEEFIQDDNLIYFLFNNHLIEIIAEGYLKDIICLKQIISKWQYIKDMYQTLNLDIKKISIFDCLQIIKENFNNFESHHKVSLCYN